MSKIRVPSPENHVKENSELLNTIFESFPYPIWISDDKGILIKLNKPLQELFELNDDKLDSIIGKYNLFKDPQVREQGLLPTIKKAFFAGEVVEFVFKFNTARIMQLETAEKSISRIFAVTITPISDEEGNLKNAFIMNRDITDQSKLGNYREERLKILNEYSSEDIWRIDLIPPICLDDPEESQIKQIFERAIFTEANDQTAMTYGYKKGSEMVGKPLREFFHPTNPKNVESMRAYVTSKFEMKDVISYEETSQGNDLILYNNIKPHIIDNKVHFVLGNTRNVTELFALNTKLEKMNKDLQVELAERKAAIEALSESEERFQKFAHAAFEGIGIAVDGIFQDVNEELSKMTGYSKKELIGNSIMMIIHTDDHKTVGTKIKENYEGVYEFRCLKKDGSVIDVEAHVTSITYKGKRARMAGIYDITKRKNAEKNLRLSEQKYKNILSNIPDIVSRSEYKPKRGFTFMSGPIEETFGYTIEEFYADPDLILKILHPDDLHLIDSFIEKLDEGKIPMTFRYIHKDGKTVVTEVRGTPIYNDQGELIGNEAITRDITEIKKGEDDLRKTVEELNRLKEQIQAENIYLRDEIKSNYNFIDIVGKSKELEYVLYRVEQVAPTDTSVLILGETGVGKELIARGIHQASTRKDRPFIKVNCANLPANLIESELFGHEKGSFTGAIKQKTGRFEVADKATIFLDEIAELPLELQSKILRVLQDGEFERIGNSNTLKVDVRVIAATNRDIKLEVKEGSFRSDLYYRLNVFPITVPPLRERKQDIPLLLRTFVEKYNKKLNKQINNIPQKTMNQLVQYSWPGNIRELENIVERAAVISQDSTLRLLERLDGSENIEVEEQSTTLQEMEKKHILKVLNETYWRIEGPSGAAAILGLNPSTLRGRMRKLDIQRPAVKGNFTQ